MSLTNDQLETRIIVIEEKLNDIQEVINNLATKRDVRALNIFAQSDAVDQETAIEARLTALETTMNTVQEILNKVTTKRQLNAVAAVRQAEVNELQTRVTQLESQVALLEA